MQRVLCLLGLWGIFLGAGQAAPRLGKVSYQFSEDLSTITLSAENVRNDSKENTTGTLKLQLWACAGPYEGGRIQGSLIATSGKIDGMGPGQYYETLRRVAPYTPPGSAGTYSLTFVLLEYRGGEYVIADSVNMPTRKALAPLPLFELAGPWKWQTSYEGGTVEMSVAKISHRRNGATGTLRLAVWLTDEPYEGGRLRGYEIGWVRKDALQKGFVFNNVKNTGKFIPPPAGNYYASLVLSEFRDGEYVVVDHLSSRTLSHFNAPPAQ